MSGYYECACCGMDEMGSDEIETNLCDRCRACGCGEEGDDPSCRECIIDGASGIYVPQRFAREYAAHWYGIAREDREILLSGPEHEHYWEAWDAVLNDAWYYNDKTHQVWRLEQDDDLFAWVEAEIEFEKEN